MALNREQKRMARRQGALDADGEPVRTRSQPATARPKEERASAGQFVREVRGELRKVAWPSRAEVVNYSLVVLVTIVVITTMIAGLDWGFAEGVLKLFER